MQNIYNKSLFNTLLFCGKVMHMTIREKQELLELEFLSPYASLSSRSKGRKRPEPEIYARATKETGIVFCTRKHSGG